MKDLDADVDSLGCGSSGGASVDMMGGEQIVAHRRAPSNKVEAAVGEW